MLLQQKWVASCYSHSFDCNLLAWLTAGFSNFWLIWQTGGQIVVQRKQPTMKSYQKLWFSINSKEKYSISTAIMLGLVKLVIYTLVVCLFRHLWTLLSVFKMQKMIKMKDVNYTILRVPTKIWKQNSMTFPWLFHDWFASFHDSHSRMISDTVIWLSHNMHGDHKLESCHSHENKQFHDFSMTSSYFPWLFGKFSYSKTFPWLSMTAIFSRIFQDIPWLWEPCILDM